MMRIIWEVRFKSNSLYSTFSIIYLSTRTFFYRSHQSSIKMHFSQRSALKSKHVENYNLWLRSSPVVHAREFTQFPTLRLTSNYQLTYWPNSWQSLLWYVHWSIQTESFDNNKASEGCSTVTLCPGNLVLIFSPALCFMMIFN